MATSKAKPKTKQQAADDGDDPDDENNEDEEDTKQTREDAFRKMIAGRRKK